MNDPLRFALSAVLLLSAAPCRAEGAGLSQGVADKNPTANPIPPPSSGDADSCPRTTPTAAVDATPGWLGDLAFDSKSNRWLVVSHAGSNRGWRLVNDGRPVTASFAVSSPGLTAGWAPMAAYSPDADKYLVVWVDYSKNSLYGRFVSSAGTPEKEFTIASELGGLPLLNLGGERTSAMRYDSANKKFVAVWQGKGGDYLSVLTTIDLNGARGRLVEVGAPKGNWAPSVAVNPDKNEYCVAYDQRNGLKWAVSRIDASTLASGPESSVGIVTTNVEISYNAATKKYLLIYDAGYAVGIKARVLNSCNANDGGADTLILPNGGYGSAAANPKSKAYAAIGQNWQDAGNSYSVMSAGAPASNVLFATGSKNGNFLPVIRANTIDGTFAATSSRDYQMTRFVAKIGCGGGTAVPGAPGSELLTWLSPSSNGRGSGKVPLAGTVGPSIKKVAILVNLKKVGDALLAGGAWVYTLDTGPYKGGFNLSALATDDKGATSRYTIRFNVDAP